MSCIRSLVAVSFLASVGFSTAVTAQEMISDTTARKQPLTTWGVQFEEFEYRYSDDGEELGVWNADAFYGTDDFKVRLLTTGEYEIEEQAYETLENQLVGQIPISKFFDAKAGVRFDTPEGPDRTYAVLGVAGLAPQWFEVDANLYVSDEGETSAELDAEYELLLTNYWILAATLDATVAFSEDREIGVGKGLVHLHGMWSILDVGAGQWNPIKHTINVNPGTTVYMETEVDAPGQWAFHCHLSYHAAAGMFRKVIIEGGPDSTQAKTDVIAEDGGEA